MEQVDGFIASSVRLTVIGPISTPVSGQAMVTGHMISELEPHFAQIRIANVNGTNVGSWRGRAISLRRSIGALRSVPKSDAAYMAIKSHRGMWLTTATAGLARLAGARVFLHHHSYDHIRARRLRMVALAFVAGPQANHIVLSETMANDLSHVMPEIPRPIVIGNAGFIDRGLLALALKADGDDLVLGHLGNLRRMKGVAEVVDLAVALNRAGTRARLVVGGPTEDADSRIQLDRAARELGELFEYLGPLAGEAKRAFFQEITHFVLPSRDEAVPLVLYEAMAAGVICVATRQGSIAEQLGGSPSVLADSADSFVEQTLPVLMGGSVSTAASDECRRAYLKALSESEKQLTSFVALLDEANTGGKSMKAELKRAIEKLPKPAQDRTVRTLRRLQRIYRSPTPPYARTRLSLGVKPLSFVWGNDRGQEIARYYVEELFLKEFSKDIRGRCLEFGEDRYTSRFGEKNVITKIDILNLEDGAPGTTVHADLTKPNDIPDNTFDCIICTHALHVIYEFEKAIADLHRVLRPGGVLLIAVPFVSMCDPSEGELWRFTQEGLRATLARSFDAKDIEMRAYGNSLTAAGELRGLAVHEFTKRELHHHDQRFAVDVCARAMKAH